MPHHLFFYVAQGIIPKMYVSTTSMIMTKPARITGVPSFAFERLPKCIVNPAKAILTILRPIALGTAGLHSNAAKNSIMIERKPRMAQIPP